MSSPAVPFLQCFSDSAVKPEMSAHIHAAFTKNACDSSGFAAFSKYCFAPEYGEKDVFGYQGKVSCCRSPVTRTHDINGAPETWAVFPVFSGKYVVHKKLEITDVCGGMRFSMCYRGGRLMKMECVQRCKSSGVL